MDRSLITWIAIAGGGLLALLVLQLLHLGAVLHWEDRKTTGLGYFGLPPTERERFRRALRRHARWLYPILRLLERVSTFTFEKTSFSHRGLAGPRGTCDEESFARGMAYGPRPEDVFVVTQMKSGTTWMQHLVYQVLTRGGGDLVESGTALYAISPWLEARKSVPVDDAPLVGTERPSRIIKTHFPASHCPHAEGARYVYVARHPVSCFASCADFIAANAGALAPEVEVIEEWFASDRMWWGPWPEHVRGWWARAEADESVLFVRFEEMKQDLPAVARRVAAFLGLAPLSDAELERIGHKCGFDYMQRHSDAFEMHPPHILAIDAELFVSGKSDRHRDVPAEAARRIARWCATELDEADLPLERLYPDITRG